MSITWIRRSCIGFAGVASIVATAGLAGGASPGTPPVVTQSEFARAERATTAPRGTALRKVGVEAATQTISVTVGDGPLTLLRAPDSLVLHRVAGTDRFRGEVSGLRVVDARGTDHGWLLTATLSDSAGHERGTVRLSVEHVTAMARSVEGIHPSNPRTGRFGEPIPLVQADRGASGGAFDVSLVAEATAAHRTVESLNFTIRFDLV